MKSREGKMGPTHHEARKKLMESSLDPPACKRFLFFPNYEHFLTREEGTQSREI